MLVEILDQIALRNDGNLLYDPCADDLERNFLSPGDHGRSNPETHHVHLARRNRLHDRGAV